jgi:acetyl esterase
MTAEYDVLRGDGEAYAKRPEQMGVPVTYAMQPGHVHVSASMTKVMAAARAWREAILTALRGVNEQSETEQAGEQK